jgi:alpha-tubulin suppressor-like RCC1 family protein
MVVGMFGLLGCETPPVVAGGRQSCAMRDGRVRCWGGGEYGVLGYGNTNNIGDNEHPRSAGDVSVGGNVQQLALGYYHTCALLDTGRVRCWGRNDYGQLGLNRTDSIGDDELASAGGEVALAESAIQITAGIYHTCALLASHNVRCWGYGRFGALGLGNTNNIGDNELPSSVPTVSLGGPVDQVVAGGAHTCARLSDGNVRCWGSNSTGALGLAGTATIGDNELPTSVPALALGSPALEIAVGELHSCARLRTGIKCWGHGVSGQLGYASTSDVFLPSSVGFVNFGGSALKLTAGGSHTCVLTDVPEVRCWGEGLWGALGYANRLNIGDNELPVSAGAVSLGGTPVSVSAGFDHTCATVSASDTYHVRCWGYGGDGRLGYDATATIGDDEVPSSVPFALVE